MIKSFAALLLCGLITGLVLMIAVSCSSCSPTQRQKAGEVATAAAFDLAKCAALTVAKTAPSYVSSLLRSDYHAAEAMAIGDATGTFVCTLLEMATTHHQDFPGLAPAGEPLDEALLVETRAAACPVLLDCPERGPHRAARLLSDLARQHYVIPLRRWSEGPRGAAP